MPLIDLWKTNPSTINTMGIEQILAMSGDGNLRDSSHCSEELREYLSKIESSRISKYIEQCLENSFQKSGMVLQDLVNELGRRLEYQVENGRYQGTSNTVGFDGIWRAPENKTIIVEVKTTDAYRISLETIAGYKKKLIERNAISLDASVLIIVGRQDTGDLEAQVRGSRYAWDVRIISIGSLTKLVQLKENSEGGATASKIRALLTPMEYTRLDDMVDVMFTTATEVESAINNATEAEPVSGDAANTGEKVKGIWQFTDSALLQEKRKEIVQAAEHALGTNLINKTKATLWSADHKFRIAVTISKRYGQRATYLYWYAYHPQWDEFLAEGEVANIVLGCMDLPFAFCVPRKILAAHLGELNTTTTERSTYWHLHITEKTSGKYALLLPKVDSTLDLNPYRLELPAAE